MNIPPDHDAVAFALDYPHTQTALAAEAIAGAAHAMDRALRGGAAADSVERWTLVAMAVTLWHSDRAAALVDDERMAPETARRMAERIAPVLSRDAIYDLRPRDIVGIANAHGVPYSERTVLLMLGELAVAGAFALSREDGTPEPVVCVEPMQGNPDGPWAGLVAAPLDAPGVPEPEARTGVANLRARLVAHYPGVRDWLPPGDDSTVAVLTPRVDSGISLLFSPFVVEDAAACRALDAVVAEPLPDNALLITHPESGHRVLCYVARALSSRESGAFAGCYG